jgi:hypothetical protein
MLPGKRPALVPEKQHEDADDYRERARNEPQHIAGQGGARVGHRFTV